MRNLKKFLALVLAMVMAFSLMLSASAVEYKDYPDKDNITAEFTEAVQVLTGLKVFEGDSRGFRPGDSITRGEVAAIIYRIATGDVDGNQVKIYADYGNFTDVSRDEWFAGYVGYCQNAGYIRGTSDTTFDPYGQVTGWQALAMILRVVGYDKNNEFKGTDWQVHVASLARELDITENVKNANFDTTLGYPARRDVVADLLFQTAVRVPTVTYTPALSYSDKISLTETRKNPTLGQKTFGLFVDKKWSEVDKWGTPGYYWCKDGTHARSTDYNATASTVNSTYQYDKYWMPVYSAPVQSDSSKSGYNVVATITPEPTKVYDTAGVHECDVAHDLDISTNKLFSLYVNRNETITTSYKIEATDTVTRVGGQGRETKFWNDVESKWFDGKLNVCTMVDTYLATVTNVTERVLDPAGHVIVPSYLYLDVYDGQAVGASDKTDAYEPTSATDPVKRNTSEHRVSKSSENWEYAKGDKVLVRGYTDYTQDDAAIDKTTGLAPAPLATGIDNGSGLNHTFSQTEREEAAFETNRIRSAGGNTNYPNDASNAAASRATKIDVVQKAEPVLGKQTVTYWNQAKHTVEGTDYNDAMTLFLDVAGTTTNTTFAWYFDTKGNLIGIDNVPNTVNYGVITSIWTSFTQGETNTDGTAKTYAKVLYADGTEATITIDKLLMAGTNGGNDPITAATAGAAMQKASNTIELTPVYDYDGSALGSTMKASTAGAATSDAAAKANLYVAPVASVNADVEKAWTAQSSAGYFGVIKGNLFKFVASTDGKMTAIEVGGVAANDGKYVGHYNYGAATTGTTSKLYKNFAYISVDGGTNQVAWMDNETKIMVNDGTSSKNVKCYTLSDLPGDVTITPDSEIDWADTDNDLRAEYVYVTGKIEGTITYGLFYYNGGAAQWSGVSKTGTAFGWLNGEPTTLTFANETQFNIVKNSQAYTGHLFALQLTNGVVSNVMGETTNATHKEWLLNSDISPFGSAGAKNVSTAVLLAATYGTNNVASLEAAGNEFKTGTPNGNPYTANTEALYVKDTGNVTYNPSNRTVTVGATPYYLTPNSKVVGLGMSVNQEGAILDYLNRVDNDVTIVYEQNAVKSIVEIYVATDPDVTPSTGAVYTIGQNSSSNLEVTPSGSNPKLDMGIYKNNALTNVGNVTVSYTIQRWSDAYGWTNVENRTVGSVPTGSGNISLTDAGVTLGAGYYRLINVQVTGTDGTTDFGPITVPSGTSLTFNMP